MFGKKHWEIYNKLSAENKNAISAWQGANFWIPGVLVVFGLAAVLLVENHSDHPWFDTPFYNAVLNGSLPLLAMNVLCIAFLSVESRDKSKPTTADFDIDNLISRLKIGLLILMFITLGVYTWQTVAAPILNCAIRYANIVLSAILIVLSLHYSKFIVLLQDEFLAKSYPSLEVEDEGKLRDTVSGGSLLLKRKR